MRKMFCIALTAIILSGSACALTACDTPSARSRYRIEAEYDEAAQTLTAQMTVNVVNEWDNALSEVKFSLPMNAYREGAKYSPVSSTYYAAVYYDGASYGGIAISSVSGGSYEIAGEDENSLNVTLEKPLYPDECAEISVQFTTTLPKANHRLGVGENAVNLANFYPVLAHYGTNGFEEYVYSSNGDPFVTNCADYEVTLTAAEKFVLATGGKAEEETKNGKKTYHIIEEKVRDVAFVLSEKFSVAQTETGGVTVRYYSFADEAPEATLSLAAECLHFYSRTFGSYPYKNYAVTETDFPYGGMEYPTLSMISSLLKEEDREIVVAHETAHQWWYGVVGSNQFTDAWQDEGLADYSAALFFNASSHSVTGDELLKNSLQSYRAFFSVHSQLTGKADTAMSRPLTSFSGEYEYVNISYGKGMILFDRLKEMIGDRRFYAGLKGYYERCAFRVATKEELISSFSGGGAEELFASFLDGRCVI